MVSVVGGGKGRRDCFIENESGSVVDLLGRTYNELAFHLWLLVFVMMQACLIPFSLFLDFCVLLIFLACIELDE